ncbi:hypothetical protein FHS16_001744 [Paenibacillus endophyticus]|uniref:Uncharacterized protein n=1 Tax=Paenibacillus endophyticus TaxID=1294268 RepID=A0A7W5C5T0_9BACL|nr:hypothetical protein [Paenibacillus endophyticus]MBB3151698.1 hypothetical protein [Paenibacillus endophyticus]
MVVEEFELVHHKEGTYFLRVNKNIIADYFYNLEAEFGSLIQIDVCSHCYYPGCSDFGFIEVIDFNKYIIWKEPLSSKYVSSNREFQSNLRFNQGTIFWTRAKYIEFITLMKQMNRNTNDCFGAKPTVIDLYELWRLEGSKIYSSEGAPTYTLDYIYENRIGMYNEVLSENQCELILKQAMKAINSENFEIFEINFLMKPIVMIFDIPIYKEWKCLYMMNDEVFYSIGEGLVVRIS